MIKLKSNENFVFKAIFEHMNRWKMLSTMQSFKNFSEKEIDTICGYIERNEETIINPKWHLYIAYMAFQELDSEYHFWGKCNIKCFSRTEFTYYQKCQCPSLLLWMAEVSGAFDSDNIETAVKNVTKLIDEGVKKQMLCNAIREVLPWENVKQKIRQFDEKKI